MQYKIVTTPSTRHSSRIGFAWPSRNYQPSQENNTAYSLSRGSKAHILGLLQMRDFAASMNHEKGRAEGASSSPAQCLDQNVAQTVLP